MKLVVFGLTVSSSWGNGHATLWRGLCRALGNLGHEVVFFERDVPYYAAHRDLERLPGGRLVLYSIWPEIASHAELELNEADVAMVTSYCPDGIAASELIGCSHGPLRAFYDLDTPVTLSDLAKGKTVAYLGPRGLKDFDLVFSYTGGAALSALTSRLGAKRVEPLYGSVDPEVHHPVAPAAEYRADLSYLGTYSKDRQSTLDQLLIQTAQRLPEQKFLIGGALYPDDFPWQANIWFNGHVSPPNHPAFFCSSRLTLNVTRGPMARMGYCPSGRLFEAAACGTPILSDGWEGLDQFFQPDEEILVAQTTEDAVRALRKPVSELKEMARAARERTLREHTSEQRARQMERVLTEAIQTSSTRSGSGPGSNFPDPILLK
jgi:spore maturation protein CgeB